MNKVLLIGHLGGDPVMSYTPGGMAVTKFSLAVSKRVAKSQAGDKPQDTTDWFNIVAFNQLAETCNTYLHKGSKAYMEGRLSISKYIDREKMQRMAVEVIITDMEMLSPKSASKPDELSEEELNALEGSF